MHCGIFGSLKIMNDKNKFTDLNYQLEIGLSSNYDSVVVDSIDGSGVSNISLKTRHYSVGI